MTGWICLAAYAADRGLFAAQIESIKAQTVTDWRCVVGMDGPDPALREFAEALVAGDARFEVVEFGERLGFYRNFERLLVTVAADASWVALSDQDDRWEPSKLARLLPGLEAGAGAVVGAARVVDRDGVVIAERTRRHRSGLLALIMDNQVTGSLAVFSPEVVRLALPFPEATDVSYHDHWLGVCAEADGGVALVDECVQDYVQHARNAIGEEMGWNPVSRLRRLRRVAGGMHPVAATRYLSEHRWGWRVAMARALDGQDLALSDVQRKAIAMVSRGRISWRLVRATIRSVTDRSVRPGRACALLVGALVWREPGLGVTDVGR